MAHPEQLVPLLYPDDRREETTHLDIDKTWHIIHYLLNGDAWEGDWPLVGVVMGGIDISDEDVGYGPARYLTPEEVNEVASALVAITPEALWSRFDAEAVRNADVYPDHWTGGPEERSYVTEHFERLRSFFAKAANAGEAMIVYLN